jgi:hypothetical protein
MYMHTRVRMRTYAWVCTGYVYGTPFPGRIPLGGRGIAHTAKGHAHANNRRSGGRTKDLLLDRFNSGAVRVRTECVLTRFQDQTEGVRP